MFKFLENNVQFHGKPQNFCLDQTRSLTGYKVKNFCRYNNINIITAPANDHRAFGLVELLIQTFKRPLNCMKLASESSTFTIQEVIMPIVFELSICKQKTTNVTPFEAHFGKKPNKPISIISTSPI